MSNLQRMTSFGVPQSDGTSSPQRGHEWITVINPTNRRVLLQACDFCGVVKSENSVVSACQNAQGERLISSALGHDMRMVG